MTGQLRDWTNYNRVSSTARGRREKQKPICRCGGSATCFWRNNGHCDSRPRSHHASVSSSCNLNRGNYFLLAVLATQRA
jgi:hypothetical protein